MFKHHSLLTTLPLELIDHILLFLSWPTDLHSLLFVNRFLNPIAKRILYRNIGDLPAQRAVRLLLSLANAPPSRCALVRSLLLDFSDNRVLFALELLIAKVLKLLPRLRSLNVEVSVYENRRALAWMFPRDAPFRLSSFATSIRSLSFPHFHFSLFMSTSDHAELGCFATVGSTKIWPPFSSFNQRSANSRYAVCPHIPHSRFHDPRSRTSRASAQ